MTTDLPPRPVAFAIVSFSTAQSSISSLLPLGLTAQIQDDMGKLEAQTTHVFKKAWTAARTAAHVQPEGGGLGAGAGAFAGTPPRGGGGVPPIRCVCCGLAPFRGVVEEE
jgi:hypothetical protein